MNEHAGTTLSVWMRTSQPAPEPELVQNLETEVCVIGAGISGCTTAYLLMQEGFQVVLLDDGPVGGGETERTTAHLSNALDDRYYTLERLHGETGARLAAQSHTAAIHKIAEIAAVERIPCEFQTLNGYLFLPPGGSLDNLKAELDATRRAGLGGVELLPRAPLSFFDTGPCLRFPGQGQFDPVPYLSALVERIKASGGKVFSGARVVEVAEEDGRVVVQTSTERRVVCKAAVIATNTPINDRFIIHSKQAPYRTYAIAARVPQGSVPWSLFWDTGQTPKDEKAGTSGAYHYVRLCGEPGRQGDLLIVGGEDHKTGQASDSAERWASLESWARQRFPMIERVDYRWSGQVMETVDGLAYIGRNPGNKNVFIITGDSGHGMTHGTIGGMLITDLIAGRSNAWEKLYDPSRKTLKSAGEYLKENLNVAGTFKDYLPQANTFSEEEIPLGTGVVTNQGLKKIAMYRATDGEVHKFSAVCPHLKCIVHWNPGEQSWDCPCHGSRFTAYGEVISGPAIVGLEPVGEMVAKGRH